jgi:hypothetical protein
VEEAQHPPANQLCFALPRPRSLIARSKSAIQPTKTKYSAFNLPFKKKLKPEKKSLVGFSTKGKMQTDRMSIWAWAEEKKDLQYCIKIKRTP